MNNEVKDKPLATLVPVIKSPELIKVKTISPKIVEALTWQNETYTKWDWTGQEIIGRLVPHGILTRQVQSGELSKVGELAYIEERQKHLQQLGVEYHEASKQAQGEIRALPQIFPV